MDRDLKRALGRRNAGTARVRWSTWVILAGAVVLTALFAVAAAASTHTRRVVTQLVHTRRRLPAVTAPAPPLVAAHAAAPAPPAASQQAPAPTPAPAPAAPVVVSGGS